MSLAVISIEDELDKSTSFLPFIAVLRRLETSHCCGSDICLYVRTLMQCTSVLTLKKVGYICDLKRMIHLESWYIFLLQHQASCLQSYR